MKDSSALAQADGFCLQSLREMDVYLFTVILHLYSVFLTIYVLSYSSRWHIKRS